MTAFVKEKFEFDGMFLMYHGRHENSKNMEEVNPDCHPSWVGKPRPEFVARFKYGYKPYKAWINWLVKNASVEDYLELAEKTSPVEAMKTLGYEGRV